MEIWIDYKDETILCNYVASFSEDDGSYSMAFHQDYSNDSGAYILVRGLTKARAEEIHREYVAALSRGDRVFVICDS